MLRASIAAMAFLFVMSPCYSETVIIDDFTTIDDWSLNADGGVQSQTIVDGETSRSAPSGMRITYADATPNWSNLTRAITIPPETTCTRSTPSPQADSTVGAWFAKAHSPSVTGWPIRRRLCADLPAPSTHVARRACRSRMK